MVVVPQGRFTMGAPAGEEARANLPDQIRGRSVPQHLVTIRHKLAIAKFDVTRDEYSLASLWRETNRPDPDSCLCGAGATADFYCYERQLAFSRVSADRGKRPRQSV